MKANKNTSMRFKKTGELRGFSLFTILIFMSVASLAGMSLFIYIDKHMRVTAGENIGTEIALIDKTIQPFLSHYSREIRKGFDDNQDKYQFSVVFPHLGGRMELAFINNKDDSFDLDRQSIIKLHEQYKFPGDSTPLEYLNYHIRLIRPTGICRSHDAILTKPECRIQSLIFRKEPIKIRGKVDSIATRAAMSKMGVRGGLSISTAANGSASTLRFGRPSDSNPYHIGNPVPGFPAGILAIRGLGGLQYQPYLSRQGGTMQADLNMNGNNIFSQKPIAIDKLFLTKNGFENTSKNSEIIIKAPEIAFRKTAEEKNVAIDAQRNKSVRVTSDAVKAESGKFAGYDAMSYISFSDLADKSCLENDHNQIRASTDGTLKMCLNGESQWKTIEGATGNPGMRGKGPRGFGGLGGPDGRGFRPKIEYVYESVTDEHVIPAKFGVHVETVYPLTSYKGKGLPVQCSIVKHNLNWKTRIHADGNEWRITVQNHHTNKTYVTSACNYLTITVNGKDETHAILTGSVFK
jgi:hypothetical protein